MIEDDGDDFILIEQNSLASQREDIFDIRSVSTNGENSHRNVASTQVALGRQFHQGVQPMSLKEMNQPTRQAYKYSKSHVKQEILNQESDKKASNAQLPPKKPAVRFEITDTTKIDYKMLQKELNFDLSDFQLIEEALYNLESFVPQSQKQGSAPPISQEQLIESLEKVTETSKVHAGKSFEDQNNIYRLILKVHDRFSRLGKRMPLHQQIDLMIKLLNYEVSKIETSMLSQQTYHRALMQKTFLAFLNNMTEALVRSGGSQAESFQRHLASVKNSLTQSKSRTKKQQMGSPYAACPADATDFDNEITFRISRTSKECSLDRLQDNSRSEYFPKSILKTSNEKAGKLTPSKRSQSSPNSNSAKRKRNGSPARKLLRQLEKENSPVRHYLNQQSNGTQFQLQQVEQVGPMSMFERLTEDERRLALQDKQINSQESLWTSVSEMPSAQRGPLARQQPPSSAKNSDNFKILLKCMRLWKVYTQQQIQDRFNEKQAQLEREESDDELDRQVEDFKLKNEGAIWHYQCKIISKSINSLIQNMLSEQEAFKKIRRVLKINKKQSCFIKWQQITTKMRKTRSKMNQIDAYFAQKRYGLFIDTLRMEIHYLKTKRMKMKAKKQWKMKYAIFSCFGEEVERAQACEKKGRRFGMAREKKVLSRAFEGLKMPLVERNKKLKVHRNESNAHIKATLFKMWSRIAQQNAASRLKYLNVERIRGQSLKHSMFRKWLALTEQNGFCNRVRMLFLAKLVFKSLGKFIEMRERKQMVLSACKAHIDQIRQQHTFALWRSYIEKQVQYRNFQMNVFNKMDLCRQKIVFKSWFNQIDILKRWRFLNENTEHWFARKQRRRVFQAWSKEIRLKRTFFVVADLHEQYQMKYWLKQAIDAARKMRNFRQIQARHAKRTRISLFKLWLKFLDKNRVRTLCQFQRKHEARVLSYCLRWLAKYSKNKIKFRTGMKNLLKLRASNIIRVAYINGLKCVWQRRIYFTKLMTAASCQYKSKCMRKPFDVLNRRRRARKMAITVKMQHCAILRIQCMKYWLGRYILADSSTRYATRLQTKMKSNIFATLRCHWKRKKSLMYRFEKFSIIHRENLRTRAFLGLQQHQMKRQAKRERLRDHQDVVHDPELMRNCLKRLVMYARLRQAKNETKAKYTKRSYLMMKRLIFNAWHMKAERTRKQHFMALRVKNNHRLRILNALRYYAITQLKQKYYLKKVKLRVASQVYDGIFRYMTYRKYFATKNQETQFLEKFNMLKKVFRQLKIHRCQCKFDQQTTLAIKTKFVQNRLRAWWSLYREAEAESEERRAALQLLVRHVFNRLKNMAKRENSTRHIKSSLKKRQNTFWTFNSKRRALSVLFKNMNENNINRMRKKYVKQVFLRSIFENWKAILDRLKRKRILTESAKILRNNTLIESCFRQLLHYSMNRVNHKMIIERFQERSELILKTDVLLQLHTNIQAKKQQRTIFAQKMVPFAHKRIEQPFVMWMDFTIDERKEAKAMEFYRKRKAQYIYRVCWDGIYLMSLKNKQEDAQNQAIDSWHSKLLLQKSLLSLKLATHDLKRMKCVENIIGMTSNMNNIKNYFEAFKQGIQISRFDQEQKERARTFRKSNACRKVLIALQLRHYETTRVQAMQMKIEKRIKRSCMLGFFRNSQTSKKLKVLVAHLQDQQDCRVVRSFFPRLAKATFHSQILEHMESRRMQIYQQEFFNELHKSILQKKILKSFIFSRELELKRDILICLRMNTKNNQNRKNTIKAHIDNQQEENNLDIGQIAFNCLKEHVVRRKFKRISFNVFRLKNLRRYFYAFQKYYIKQQFLRQSTMEIRKIQEAKYLWHWRQLYIKETEQHQVTQFVKCTQQHQILQFWKTYTMKRVLARHFFKNVIQRNMKSYIYQALTARVELNKRDRLLTKHIQESTEANLRHRILYRWLSQSQGNRIYRQMGQYSNIKVLKKVVSAWKQIKNNKNAKRLRTHRIRQQLQERPELGRPLKVMRNLLMFKAFNKLFEGAQQVKHEDDMTEKAMLAFYLTRIKKTFLCLKLNAQLRYQSCQAGEISDLFLKRRWLNYMKDGTRYLKQRRQMRQKASIFRFLALQKKGLGALVKHSVDSQEHRIKKEFAMKLYYKRLLDLGLSSLKIYKDYRIGRRNDPSRRASRSGSPVPEYVRERRGSIDQDRLYSPSQSTVEQPLILGRNVGREAGQSNPREEYDNMLSETSQFAATVAAHANQRPNAEPRYARLPQNTNQTYNSSENLHAAQLIGIGSPTQQFNSQPVSDQQSSKNCSTRRNNLMTMAEVGVNSQAHMLICDQNKPARTRNLANGSPDPAGEPGASSQQQQQAFSFTNLNA